MPNFSVFIFDWSGVISDDRRPVYEANMRLLKRHGKQRMTFKEWLPRTTLSAREFLANHGVIGEPDKLFEEYRQELNKVRADEIHPVLYPNTLKALEKLLKNGKKLIVVSSHPEKNLREEAKEYGIEQFFKFFIGNSKDKTRGILEACERVNVKPSFLEIAYIGDTIYDIHAAKKAGVYSIAITNGYHVKERLKKENPDKTIESLMELL